MSVDTAVLAKVTSTISYEEDTVSVGELVRPKRSWKSFVRDKVSLIFKKIDDEKHEGTYITAIIPAHNEERDIAYTLESLLQQTRVPDKIVVVVNGSTDKTADICKMFESSFSGIVEVAVNPTWTNKLGKTREVKGKVAALNYAYNHYINNRPAIGDDEYIFGCDADVILEESAIEKLEDTLIDDSDDQSIGGVRAAYGFAVPETAGVRARSLVNAQRLDFASTELRDQLRRGGRVTILGGQATAFRRSALDKVSEMNKGKGPWNADSVVEDSYLTRQLEQIGYKGVVNSKARATVGAMHTQHAWFAQRSKWIGGTMIDISADKHFALDKTRWGQQFAMLFNLVMRVVFFSVLGLAIATDNFTFHPIWLAPIGLAALQNILVAGKMHGTTPGLVIRAGTYILPEMYTWKTLAVWVSSLPKGAAALVNSGKNGQEGWLRQARAEAAKKKHSFKTWFIVAMIFGVPALAVQAVSFNFHTAQQYILDYGWVVVAGMAVISSFFLIIRILRILAAWPRLSL